ncbi:hypothetical protein BC831DRAFT_510179 [Entophlyctis helioformis]|nr:hypothetical protein BC831DRAFT_510179 [Entophlyctis helioformis]
MKQDGTGSATADADARGSVFVDRARTAPGTYLVILAFVYVTMSLFQKPIGGVAMGLAFLQVLCLIDNVALWRLAALSEVQRRNKKQEDGQDGQDGQDGHDKHDNGNADCNAAADGAAGLDLTGVYFEHLVLLLLCGQRAFFSTGHQNALPSIQYEVGFIGLDGVNWILSPMFIGINTYGGPILFALAVPLVPLWGAWPQPRSARTASSVSVSVTAGESGPSGPSGPEARRLAARIAREVGQAMLVYHGLISGAEVTGVTVFVGWFRRHSQAWRVWGPKYIFYFVGHSGIFALGIVMLGVVHQCLA